MKACVLQRLFNGEEKELWAGSIPVAPRPDEWISLNPDDGSLMVMRVEWDYSGPEVELAIYVR